MDRTSSQENYQTIITPPPPQKKERKNYNFSISKILTYVLYIFLIYLPYEIDWIFYNYIQQKLQYQEVINKKIEILETSTFISSTIHEINPCKSVPMID